MKKYLLTFLVSLISIGSFASHIVGGEIELVPLKNPVAGSGTHQITLNLYFDAINGRAQAEEQSIRIQIYRKKDLAFMGDVTCPQIYRQLIKYVDPSCAKGDLQTLSMKYSSAINLSDDKFSDPEGYIAVYERCCRNVIINNILNPSSVGMVFYLEFASNKVANTTPHFRELIADYICINQNFEMDFSATDADGDSLTYTMSVPWIGNSSTNNPNYSGTGSTSYREATFVTGINVKNMIPGDIPLQIDPETGTLFVKPNKLGLYVFSVTVDEFRKGVRIGRVKRDFQLKVIDCIINNPPQILVRNQSSKKNFQDGETIVLKKGEKRCFDILYFDADLNQKLTITARGINFDTKKILLPTISNVVVASKDTLRASFCLDDCIITKNNVAAEFFVNISDNGCPVPQNRGYRMKIQFDENANNKPTLTTSLPNGAVPLVSYGDTLRFNVSGNDVDIDTLFLTGTARNANLAALGFSFPSRQGLGSVSSSLLFIPTCEAIKQKQVLLDFVARDLRCGVSSQTLLSVPVSIQAKPNNAPSISTSLTNNTVEVLLSPSQSSEVKFTVNGQDIDNEQLTLTGTPKGFDFKNTLMSFDNKDGKGKVSSVFTWKPTCFMLNGQESKEYIVSFKTQDNNCLQKNDSVSVKLVLKDNIISENPIKPFNSFTPNADGKNDTFNLGSIPGDNCKRQFVKFEIFNRWGKSIFSTAERDFIWTGDEQPTGDYFYALSFSDDVFKGVIHLVR
jgi:gliding motility-associated-like protein